MKSDHATSYRRRKRRAPDHEASPAAERADAASPAPAPELLGAEALAHPTAHGLRQVSVLGMQRSLGNAHVQRKIGPARSLQRNAATESAEEGVCPVCGRKGKGTCPGCGQAFVPIQRQALLQRDDATADPAVRAAQGVYDALDGWDNERKALQSLSVADKGVRDRIPEAFRSLPKNDSHQSIQSYLKDQLSGDDLVRAYALLSSGNVYEPHTSVALALIGAGTRDEELARVLEGRPLSGRQELERRYDATFGPIGSGSLRKDLKDDLTGWRLQKMTVLLERELTDADHLFFHSVAITGTHSDSVVAIVQQYWQGGPQKFADLDQQWERNVRNKANGTEIWTNLSLEAALKDEMDAEGESWEIVKSVLDGYRAFKSGNFTPGTDGRLTAEQREGLENIRLNTAWATLKAATTGGYTGTGTNEEQVFRATTDIRNVWQERLAWARAHPESGKLADYEAGWAKDRDELRRAIGDEMDSGTADNQRAQLLLEGELTIADEVYLAKEALDYEKVQKLITQYWCAGKIGELQRLAREPRTDTGGKTLRPVLDLVLLVPVTSGVDFQRVYALVRADKDDAGRGAERLKIELDEGTNDSDLKRAYEFLTAAKNPSLQSATINAFAGQQLSNSPGETPVKKFLNHITKRYENSYTCYEFMDLLDPAATPQQMLERAEGRKKASNSGILNAVLNQYVNQYDQLTGEETAQVADESLERLRFIVQHSGADKAELDAMIAMSDAKSPDELAKREYGDFVTRLNELRALKRAIADAIAQAVELVVDALLTVATGGGAAGLLVASLGAAIAGMVAREMMLGQDYDLLSKENAQQLAMVVASHGFGALGRTAFHDIVSPEKLKQLGRAGSFLEGAVAAGVAQAGTQTLAASFSNKMPSAEGIASSAISILGASAGAGLNNAISGRVNSKMSVIGQLRVSVGANVTQEIVGGLTDEGATMLRGGVGDLSGPEIAGRFGQRGARAVGSGIVGGLKDVGAQHVAEQRQNQPQNGDESNLQGQEHGSSGGANMMVDPGTANSDRPGVIAVKRVHPDHTISIFRGADGRIVVKICSDCAKLYEMLNTIRAELGPEKMPQHVYDDYRGQIAQIEERLNKSATDAQALEAFGKLGDELRTRLEGAQARLDGTTATGALRPDLAERLRSLGERGVDTTRLNKLLAGCTDLDSAFGMLRRATPAQLDRLMLMLEQRGMLLSDNLVDLLNHTGDMDAVLHRLDVLAETTDAGKYYDRSGNELLELNTAQAHLLVGEERHHPFFRMFLRAFDKAGVPGVRTEGGRMRPQRLVDLPTNLHQKILHQLWNKLFPNLKAAKRGDAIRVAEQIRAGEITPTQIADRLADFYRTALSDDPARRDAVLGSLQSMRDRIGI